MNDRQEQLREIERDEAWLSGVLSEFPEPAPRGLENLKLTVRIAAQEQVFDAMASPGPSYETLAGVKRAVRAELDLPQAGHRWGGFRWSHIAGGLAAAAAIAFWFMPIGVTSSNVLPASENLLVEVLGGSGDGDEELEAWSDQVGAVETEMQYVADLLVSDDSGWDDYRLNDLDALDEQIDELYEELEGAIET